MKPVNTGRLGAHGFEGKCAPLSASKSWGDRNKTFSVGVFQWVARREGGVKRGKVKVRVRGWMSAPDPCLKRAAEIAAQLDAGTYDGPKVVEAWK